jgi:chemotaxis protein CheD
LIEYFDYKLNKKTVSILPGEYYVTEDDIIIQTVLGSCISVCLFSDKSDLAGMNHFMLPENTRNKKIDEDRRGIYGSYAMDLLLRDFIKQGLTAKDLKAKILGGGNMFNIANKNNIADNNINYIVDYLQTEKISVISTHMGSNYGRKIQFFTRSKEVFVKKVSRLNVIQVKVKEDQLMEELEKKIKNSPDITLF